MQKTVTFEEFSDMKIGERLPARFLEVAGGYKECIVIKTSLQSATLIKLASIELADMSNFECAVYGDENILVLRHGETHKYTLTHTTLKLPSSKEKLKQLVQISQKIDDTILTY